MIPSGQANDLAPRLCNIAVLSLQGNALVDILGTLTINTLVPDRAIVAASLASYAHDNFHVTRTALADIVFCQIAARLARRIPILHEH